MGYAFDTEGHKTISARMYGNLIVQTIIFIGEGGISIIDEDGDGFFELNESLTFTSDSYKNSYNAWWALGAVDGPVNATPIYSCHYEALGTKIIGIVNQGGIVMQTNIEIVAPNGTNAYNNWIDNTDGNVYTLGNVGIGTDSPQQNLHIAATTDNITPATLRLTATTSYGETIYSSIDIVNSPNMERSILDFRAGTTTTIGGNPTMTTMFKYDKGSGILVDRITDINDYSYYLDPASTGISLRVAGKIEVKGFNSGFEVAGKITCEELEVKDIAADFVFEADYKLRSLQEVEAFIIENKHLPDFAPASETEKGVELGKFNTLLLQKIEELTLYIIEQQKEIDELAKKLKK